MFPYCGWVHFLLHTHSRFYGSDSLYLSPMRPLGFYCSMQLNSRLYNWKSTFFIWKPSDTFDFQFTIELNWIKLLSFLFSKRKSPCCIVGRQVTRTAPSNWKHHLKCSNRLWRSLPPANNPIYYSIEYHFILYTIFEAYTMTSLSMYLISI